MQKILIVEDDRVLASIYQSKLSVEGFTVEVCRDGETAIQTYDKAPTDLVLLDLMLPKINGIEVIKHIRHHPKRPNVPIVVFSNSFLNSLVQDAWKAGATKFITKHSCTPKDLVQAIRNTLAEKDKEDVAQRSEHPPEHDPEPPAPAPQLELRDSLLQSSSQITDVLRTHLHILAKTENPAQRLEGMAGLYSKIHSLTGNAGLAGWPGLAQICSALEAFLKELETKPDRFSPSTLRTLAQAVDLVPLIFSSTGQSRVSVLAKSLIMVLDDEKFSRRAVCAGLAKAGFRALQFENPKIALQVAMDNPFDLMFIDLQMPEMNGVEFCAQVRAMETNRLTPIVFVTGHTDFESRTRTILSGGTDLIGKPFLLMEVAMKALIYLLKTQILSPPVAVPR